MTTAYCRFEFRWHLTRQKQSVYDVYESLKNGEIFFFFFFFWSSDVGSWSSSQVFFAVFLRMLCTSFSDAGVN